MTNVIQKSGNTYHQCGECKFVYAKKALAEQCEAWCKEHKTCNIEITKHAVNIAGGSTAPLNKQTEKVSAREDRNAERARAERRRRLIRLAKRAGYIVVAVAVIALGIRYLSNQPNLPPTNMQGHIEESPKSHIVDAPMPDAIQRHMLEHADGKGKPGVLIQYNCKKYSCESDLIQKLTDLVKQYPNNVYLAPNDYDGKIILTKMGSIKVLDGFDEQAIKDFIGR
jgi:hypothetical protein